MITDLIRQLTLFSGLTEDELSRLVVMGRELTAEPGEVVIHEGDPGDSLYLILEGEFEVVKQANDGEEMVARRGPGEVFGEMSLLDNKPRMATVRAVRPGRLFMIDQRAFDALLSWSPAASRAILRTVSARLRTTETMLLQREKMAALGTLAAGIAHELNNPAAAARRAAEQLKQQLARAEQRERAVDALELNAAQRESWGQWLGGLALLTPGSALDPLARSDREGEVESWLTTHDVAEAWELAPALVSLGLGCAHLDQLAQQMEQRFLSYLLGYVASRGSMASLAEEIESSAERISSIVASVKSYAYLDQAPLQEVDVHAGLENTLVILRYKLKRGITIQRAYSPDLPHIDAYASELNQVWTNIIDNAIDAMGGQGQLTLRTHVEGSWVVVDICDNGLGIPPEIQARIFEPFFTTKPVGSGTGLGLHITYNIVVVKHRGEIEVQSRPGETCFTVKLPRHLRPAPDERMTGQ